MFGDTTYVRKFGNTCSEIINTSNTYSETHDRNRRSSTLTNNRTWSETHVYKYMFGHRWLETRMRKQMFGNNQRLETHMRKRMFGNN